MDNRVGKKDPKLSLQDVGTPPEASKQLGDELAEELPATRTPDLTGLPSMSEVGKGYDEIFGMIEAGDHIEVEKFLAKRGQKVEIKPKIGCSPIHYTKFNVCNFENANQDTPLITAAKVNTRMVEIVLQYGGNPNHVNKDGDTPISIAANRCDKDSIDALLWAGGNLTAAVIKLTSTLRYVTEKQLKECAQAGFSVKPLIVLLADDVYLKCRDPIRAAFDVYKEIKHIKHVRDEFRIEFESLMEASDLFVYKFLNHCDEMAEAREILQLNSSRNLLKTAIDRRKKQFVSHPFSQQIIHEQWYGETANRLFWGKLSISLKYLTSIVVLPLMFLKFLLIDVCRGVSFMESSCSHLMRFLSIPCLCFATDAMNYIGFLVVLISTCLSPFGDKTYEVTTIEYVLYYSVFARIFIEADLLIQQGSRNYFRKFWNGMNIVVLGLLVAGAVMKTTIQYVIDKQADNYAKELNVDNSTDESLYTALEAILINQHRKSMNVNYMYAVAEFILVIRLMSLLEIVKSLGPMLIALKYLLIDVIKFSVILLMVIMGTSISLYSMTIALNEWNEELNYIRSNITWPEDYPKDLPVVIIIPKVFNTFTDTIRNVLWGTFGLLDVAGFNIKDEAPTTNFINVMMILYVLLSCVLLLNMLIGILSSTFNGVKENADIEWKFAQSQILEVYSRAQPFLFPFFPFLFPIVIWHRAKLAAEKKKQHEKDVNIMGENERDKVIATVCDRIMLGKLVDDKKALTAQDTLESRIKYIMMQTAALQRTTEEIKDDK